MAGNTFYINTDLHTSALSTIDAAICRLCGNNKFRTNLVFVDDVLPAKTIAVLFLNSSCNNNLIFVIKKTKIFHDLSTVNSRYDTTHLIRSSTSADLSLSLKSFIGIEFPVVSVSDTYSINMSVETDESASGSHIAKDISHWVNLNFIKAKLLHLFFNTHYMILLTAALAWKMNQFTKKFGHICFIILCSFFDFVIIHNFLPPFFVKKYLIVIKNYLLNDSFVPYKPSHTISR